MISIGSGETEAEIEDRIFSPAKLTRQTLNDQIYDGLREAIITGSLLPGKVLTIRELADSFGVSVMPVREALSRLIAEKALVFRPNRSVAVPVLTPHRFEQITRIRLLLEGLATRDGTAGLHDFDIARMEGLNSRMETIGQADRRAFLELNRQIHFGIYAASRQDYLIGLIESRWLQIGPLLNFILQGLPATRATLQTHHRELIAALRDRDAAAAERAIQDDIQQAADFILPFLMKTQPESSV